MAGASAPCCSAQLTANVLHVHDSQETKIMPPKSVMKRPRNKDSFEPIYSFQFIFLCLLLFFVGSVKCIEMDICHERSCYPETGNLLIGREHRLSSTSTCGMRGKERYCIVSHLEEPKKCFWCDSRHSYVAQRGDQSRSMSHRVENIVSDKFDRSRTKWWQSENGLANVSVQLDLEAEFHFTHLIMTFKSFRPAAMLIERSADRGKTWRVYRVFAKDCDREWPDFPEKPAMNNSEVVCDSSYSDIEPSSGGEVVFKVLPPHIPLEDPYAPDVQDLLRITNLRINFTKLHTLGDDLLDYRTEIDQKYYYAIYDMVVRGSCSCYGHAYQCIPIQQDGIAIVNSRPDMVHGQCNCTHHTTGHNCEKCQDFYNDLPWRPAIDRDRNECRECSCNRHARRCHFDRAAYEASGFVSGGVCDDCMHNTMGKNCEQCKPYFYRLQGRPIQDEYTCSPCQCDARGSLNEGICDSETDEESNLVAGRCHCKPNVDGDRCDRCKNGFWDLDKDDQSGCKKCSCFLTGTYNNEGCDKYTGKCTCKRLVTGENCDQCLPEHYGLSEDPDGCKLCDCDLGGSVTSDCDVNSGQCQCRPNFSGRRCDKPESGFFCANVDYFTYEAESAKLENGAESELREHASSSARTFTGTGFARARESSKISFDVPNLAVSMKYSLVIRFETTSQSGWQEVRVLVVRPDQPDPNGPCAANYNPGDDISRITQLYAGGRYVEVRPEVCLEANTNYQIVLDFGQAVRGVQDPSAAVLIDSIVISPITSELDIFSGSPKAEAHRETYDRYQCRHTALSLASVDQYSEVCRNYLCAVAAVMLDRGIDCKCDPTGSQSGICDIHGGQCQCKTNVIGRMCDRCAPGHYGFGPVGCSACECNSVGSLGNFCDLQTGQCKCKDKGIYGRQCDQCQPGFFGFPECRPCQCNSHADICDQKTGACIECRDLTGGHNCDRCQDGYYGDPRLGVDIACRPCPCPGGPGSGKQHADTCYLQPGSKNVVCNCKAGYQGVRCDECIQNHWGNPQEVGGSCEQCECNNNIDVNTPESCDVKTGECTKCLFNTDGFQCQHCVDGFFGDATIRQCQRCICNMLGTNSTGGSCDRISGQCVCLPNVIGLRCDQCAENHWKIASGVGCDKCDCDPNGVVIDRDGNPMLQCNEFDGQCACKAERGGRQCNECQDQFWGDPVQDNCVQCKCNTRGSASLQCDRSTGICTCLPGSGGPNCDQCARGYTGRWPNCHPCGECFQNWDKILTDLQERTSDLISRASNIEDTGLQSAYDDEFKQMDSKLDDVRALLNSANVSKEDVQDVQDQIEKLQELVQMARDDLNLVDDRITVTTAGVDTAQQTLNNLREDADALEADAMQLEKNATILQESDVEGAYNISRASASRSRTAQNVADGTDAIVGQSETTRREAQGLLDQHKQDFDKAFVDNQQALEELGTKLNTLSAFMPDVNAQVCGKRADPCDEMCGGAGCGFCGGPTCGDGAKTKAEQALKFAQDASRNLDDKQKEAEQLLQKVRASMQDSERARKEAESALETAQSAAQQANQTKANLEELVEEMQMYLDKPGAVPEEIRTLAEEVLNMTIPLTPDQIRDLAEQIRATLDKLTNIDEIIRQTSANLTLAQNLKMQADRAKERAESILNTTAGVRNALEGAGQAQTQAKQAIDVARGDIEKTKDLLSQIEDETKEAESDSDEAKAALAELRDQLDDVGTEYVTIKEEQQRAITMADMAVQKSKYVEDQMESLQNLYDTAEAELDKRRGDGDVPKDRAEALRKDAAVALDNTQKHLKDIQEEKKNFDANELRLAAFGNQLDDLHLRMDAASELIRQRLHHYETCD